MRWSQAFIPTLRDDPTDAEAPSHRLLVRAGYVRQLMAGSYSLLPLAHRVRAKIRRVIEEEMDAIGGQQLLLPALHPAEMWRRSGRYDIMGDELFRLDDRRGSELVLGMTHEENITSIATEVTSYRQLPQIWYQIQTKFRDEPRPKSGLLRTREFTMKDAYSFDVDTAGLDRSFELHDTAYRAIFRRLGLDAVPVVASSGAMGGRDSTEFMVRAAAGEDEVAHCSACGYAANIERAVSRLDPVEDPVPPPEPERFATPGVRTIEALAGFEGGAAAERQIKTLVYVLDGSPTLVLLRGDHPLQEQKLLDGTGSLAARPAAADEIRHLLGADAGSLGAVGVKEVRIVADEALQGRTNLTTGANEDGFHLRGVDIARDIEVDEWLDLREVRSGEPCPVCGSSLEIFAAIEVGHIFKLGSRYSDVFDASVLDATGKRTVVQMGSYGIGLERNLAAVVEASHDDKGIVWPVSVAPYEVVVTVVKIDDPDTMEAGERLYADLVAAGVDTLIDDRGERPGVKFNDAELIGIPYRLTVGPRGVGAGEVELTSRDSGVTEALPLGDAAATVADLVASERR